MTDLYRPASVTTNAGGDWYDVIQVSERCTLIAIGDVANHGAVAVGEMARTRATVHAPCTAGLGTGGDRDAGEPCAFADRVDVHDGHRRGARCRDEHADVDDGRAPVSVAPIR